MTGSNLAFRDSEKLPLKLYCHSTLFPLNSVNFSNFLKIMNFFYFTMLCNFFLNIKTDMQCTVNVLLTKRSQRFNFILGLHKGLLVYYT